jgi:hypothetical protein
MTRTVYVVMWLNNGDYWGSKGVFVSQEQAETVAKELNVKEDTECWGVEAMELYE